MSISVYGIDLGTTYSSITRISDLGAPEILPNFEGDQTTPSVVFFEAPGAVIVGAEAKRSAVSDPDNACLLIKRQMGTDYLQEFQGETYTPEAISALILKELVRVANQESGGETAKAVITVPAYFGAQEREATRQAGQIAGIEVVGIVTEPVAAALSIGARGDRTETIMVYDLGGGTFDTTILTLGDGRVEVVAVDGNRKLGGADWDEVLIDLIVEKFSASADLGDEDPRHDEEFMIDLQLEAESAKVSLSLRESKTLRLAFDGRKATVEVTRAEFEEATQHLVAQTVEIAERTLELARKKDPSIAIDRVLLVGGSSRMPQVRRVLKEQLGWDAEDTDFDLAVSKGAAIYGQAAVDEIIITGDELDPVQIPADAPPRPFLPGAAASLSVQNVLSRSIGVKLVRDAADDEGYIKFFAHANDSIPLDPDPIEAATVVDNQISVTVSMYEQAGERESEGVADNRLMTDAVLKLPEALPAHSPLHMVARISSEGLVTLVATDAASGESIELQGHVSVLSDEEVATETSKVDALTLRS